MVSFVGSQSVICDVEIFGFVSLCMYVYIYMVRLDLIGRRVKSIDKR